MTPTTPARPPVGRYGPETDERRRRLGVLGLWALGALAVAVAVWIGLGAGRAPVTWQDVGFSLEGSDRVQVVYDVSRPDPSVAVRCRLQALNQQYAQVGVLTVDIPPGGAVSQRLTSTVATSEAAVTGVVEECWVP